MALGRSAGLTDEEMGHVADDPLPEGMFSPDEEAIIRFAQRSTRMQPIDDILFDALAEHFSIPQLLEICFTVGLNQVVSRMHALLLTDVDEVTLEAVADDPPLPLPQRPSVSPRILAVPEHEQGG